MIEAAKAERGELILVVLGPLTNLALACKLDPHLPSRGNTQMQGCSCLFLFSAMYGPVVTLNMLLLIPAYRHDVAHSSRVDILLGTWLKCLLSLWFAGGVSETVVLQ